MRILQHDISHPILIFLATKKTLKPNSPMVIIWPTFHRSHCDLISPVISIWMSAVCFSCWHPDKYGHLLSSCYARRHLNVYSLVCCRSIDIRMNAVLHVIYRFHVNKNVCSVPVNRGSMSVVSILYAVCPSIEAACPLSLYCMQCARQSRQHVRCLYIAQ